jgi:hypothetical protein
VSVTSSHEHPSPTQMGDKQGWQSVFSGDTNANGIVEQASYRPLQVQLREPVGFSDPSIAHVLFAEELLVVQDAAPDGRQLLHVNGEGIFADEQLLAAPGPEGLERLAGFLVVIYEGERYSYRITPIKSNGTLSGEGVQVVWSQLKYGYRIP